MMEFLRANWIELVGTILSLVYLYLSVKQHIGLWLFGFLSSAFYIVIFLESGFYADMTLQVYYLVVSIYGYWHWRWGKRVTETHELPVEHVSARQIPYLLGVAVLIWVAYYIVLRYLTDSEVPVCDSLTTALSIVATWMLARKILEHWLIWVFVDAFSALLYVHKGLYITPVLYVIYTIMAVVGYFQWRSTLGKPSSR